ncbi:MAG: glycosyltransferase [Pseudomonadota bacterium]
MNKHDVIVCFKNGIGREFIKDCRSEIPKVLWIHGGIPFVDKSINFDLSQFTKIVCLTDTLLAYLQQKNPDVHEKFIRIYNPLQIDTLRQASHATTEDFGDFFVCVSRLYIDKDIKTVIDAYDSFFQRTKSTTALYLVGDGPSALEFQEYAASKSSAQQIIFKGYQKNPFVFMKQAKAVILSSASEGLPCVLCEGLACSEGVVISSDCPCGPREVLLDGKCGLLFPVGDTEKLSYYLSEVDCGAITRSDFEAYIPESLERFASHHIYEELCTLFETC